MKKILVAFILSNFIIPSVVLAGNWDLQLHGLSYHFSNRTVGDWEQFNRGVGIRYEFNDTWSLQAGQYKNSDSTPAHAIYTNYGLIDVTPFQADQFHFGGFVGMGSRYENGVRALGGLIARWQGDIFNVTTRLAPKVNDSGSVVLAFEVGMRF